MAPVTVAKFVDAFDSKEYRSQDAKMLTGHHFRSGVNRGWTYSDGSKQAIFIMRFPGSADAESEFRGLGDDLIEDMSKGWTKVTDPADAPRA